MYSGGRLRCYGKSKISNISKITASTETNDIPLESPMKLPLEMQKKLLNF